MAVSSEYLMYVVRGEGLIAIGIEGKQEGAQDATLWGSCVGGHGHGGGCNSAHPYCLRSVAEEALYPVDEEWEHVEAVEFPDHLVTLKGRTEVHVEKFGKVTGCFQVL